MKRYISILTIILAAGLVSCSKDAPVDNPSPVPSTGETKQTTLRIGKKEMQTAGITSKAGYAAEEEGLSFTVGLPGTREGSLADDDEYAFHDLLVVQIAEGNYKDYKVIGTPFYTTLSQVDHYTLTDFTYVSQNSLILAIANMGSPDLFTADTEYSSIEISRKLLVSYTGEEDVTAGDQIIFSGSYDIDRSADYSSGIELELYRRVARIDFNIILNMNPGEHMSLTSVQLKSVPSVLLASDWAYDPVYNVMDDWMTTFPPVYSSSYFHRIYDYDTSADLFMDYAPIDVSTSDRTSFTWYMPEHWRGDSYGSIYNQKDKYWANDPSYLDTQETDDEGSYSTHIEIKGQYTYPNGSTKPITITLYPGGNNSTNFDMAGNTIYPVNLRAQTFDPNDPRIDMAWPDPSDIVDPWNEDQNDFDFGLL